MFYARFIALTKNSILFSILIATAQLSFAQNAMQNAQAIPLVAGLSVSATSEAKVMPSKVRLSLPVRVETRESDTLLKTLKGHQDDVKKHLTAFGIAAETIEFSLPIITGSVPGVENPEAARKAVRQQAIQSRNLNPQMRAQFPIPPVDAIDDSDLPIVYSAESNLTVDWKIQNGMDEKAMLLPSKIKMLMEEKGFSGKDLREVLSDEEQKMVEPLMGNNGYAVYYPNASRDQRLFFVGEITEEVEKEAIASAVKKGRNEAKALAESAGLKLGKLRSIQKAHSTDSVTQQQATAILALQMGGSATTSREKHDREVTSVDPNLLRRTIVVNMVFDIE